LSSTANLGIDLKGNNVNIIDQESVGLMNEIFRTFDQKGKIGNFEEGLTFHRTRTSYIG